jgi:hypothetical protein
MLGIFYAPSSTVAWIYYYHGCNAYSDEQHNFMMCDFRLICTRIVQIYKYEISFQVEVTLRMVQWKSKLAIHCLLRQPNCY